MTQVYVIHTVAMLWNFLRFYFHAILDIIPSTTQNVILCLIGSIREFFHIIILLSEIFLFVESF